MFVFTREAPRCVIMHYRELIKYLVIAIANQMHHVASFFGPISTYFIALRGAYHE